jgi:hypothetical protein
MRAIADSSTDLSLQHDFLLTTRLAWSEDFWPVNKKLPCLVILSWEVNALEIFCQSQSLANTIKAGF